jgi:D-tyrosyl-tRNA(Tyr) deacylase
MIAVVQRVSRAGVRTDEPPRAVSIDGGLLVLLGVERGDAESEADWMVGKIAALRIFRDDEARMNRSVVDVGGSVLVVSQFTLVGDCARGNRPSFARAADPVDAERLYEHVIAGLRGTHGLPIEHGVFGATMQVDLVNDGPVTITLQSGQR